MVALGHNSLPLPWGLILASGPPVTLKYRAIKIEPAGFSQGRMSVSAFRGLKLTEREAPGGDAPKEYTPHRRTALDFSGWRLITLPRYLSVNTTNQPL